nr:aldo-keto reductase family 1 member E2 [Molossus molossus]
MVIPSNTNFLDTWEAMEDLVTAGLVKAIGVSNFNHEQLERILTKPNLRVRPLTNQIECHPYLTQRNLISFCQSRDVSVIAYQPLGGSSGGVDLMDNPVIQTIARKHHKSPAQILIRFQIQRNVIVVPKSVNPKRILENIQVFDFELTEQDMNDLLRLNRNLRLTMFPTAENHKDYPFHIEF